MDLLTPLAFVHGVPPVLGDGVGIPAPAITLAVVILGMVLALGVESLTLRGLWSSLRAARVRMAPRSHPALTVATLDARGDLAEVLAAIADRTDVGFDDIEAALDHEWWVRRFLRREIVRRGGVRRELDQLRRTHVLFAVRPSSTSVHFDWDGRVGSDEPQPFHEWLSDLRRDLDHDFVVAPVDMVVDHVFDLTPDGPGTLDAHTLHVLTGLDDPAVGGAVVPTGPPAAVRTTPNRVLPTAA